MNIEELSKRLQTECFADRAYTIGLSANRRDDVFCIEPNLSGFDVFYFERGRRLNVRHFESELDACFYFYQTLLRDRTARAHLLTICNSRRKAERVVEILFNVGVRAEIDQVNSETGSFNNRFRVYVYGCDILTAREAMVDGAVV